MVEHPSEDHLGCVRDCPSNLNVCILLELSSKINDVLATFMQISPHKIDSMLIFKCPLETTKQYIIEDLTRLASDFCSAYFARIVDAEFEKAHANK